MTLNMIQHLTGCFTVETYCWWHSSCEDINLFIKRTCDHPPVYINGSNFGMKNWNLKIYSFFIFQIHQLQLDYICHFISSQNRTNHDQTNKLFIQNSKEKSEERKLHQLQAYCKLSIYSQENWKRKG